MYVDSEMAAVDLRDRLTAPGPTWPKVQPFLLRLRRRTAVLVVHHSALAGHEIEPIETELRIDAAGRADWAWWPIELRDSHRVAALLRGGRNPNQIAHELGISKIKAYRLRERVAATGPRT